MTRIVALETKDGDGSSQLYDTPQVHLGEHHLKKLGLHGNIEDGHEVHIRAKGKVHHSSSSTDEKGKKHKNISVRLTHMGIMERGETPTDERDESPSGNRAELRAGIEKAHADAERRRKK